MINYCFQLKLKWLPFFLNDDYYGFLFFHDFKAMIAEFFLLFAICCVLLYGIGFTNIKKNQIPILGNHLCWIAVVLLFFTCMLLKNNPIMEAAVFYHHFKVDSLSFFFKMLVIIASVFSIVISLQYVEQEKINAFELQIIILISTLSMLFLISSADLVSIYLAIELQSLCFYVMAGIKRVSEFSSEAGLKYFLLGAFSSGILGFGFALEYGFTGTTNLEELSKIFVAFFSSSCDTFSDAGEKIMQGSHSLQQGFLYDAKDVRDTFGGSSLRGTEFAMILILVGFLFKLSAVPFHMWAPDVYEGAPTCVTAFFAIVPKISILAIMVRFCYGGFYDFMFPWQKILILSSIASMILGSVAALSQNKIKRLLAWSSINHVGYFLIAVCCGTTQSLQALVFYLVLYLVMTITLFQTVLCSLRGLSSSQNNVINRFGARFSNNTTNPEALDTVKQNDNTNFRTLDTNQRFTLIPHLEKSSRLKYLTHFAHLAKTNQLLAISLTITMFSIAGIPPLAGFYSKAFLLFSAMSVSQFLLATIAILTSVISCFYYIRIVKIMYFQVETSKAPLTFMEIPKQSSLVFAITIAILSFFCFCTTPLFCATHKMALSCLV